MTEHASEEGDRPFVARAGCDYNVPDGYLRLDLNTNLFGPNPAVGRVLRKGDLDTCAYPSVDSVELRTALAKEWKVDPKHVITGNGVDDILNLAVRAYTERGDTIAYPGPSFFMYEFFSRTYGCTGREIPLGPRFQLDVGSMLATKAKLMFIANPNNPTGNKFKIKDVEGLLDEAKGVVAVDEAYIEYSGGSFVKKLGRYPNLVVFRTFSKAYALAGLRVGSAVSKGSWERLAAVRPPFNLNVVSEAAALAALRNKAWLKRTVGTVKRERARLSKALRPMGFVVNPSDANFLLCRSPVDSTRLCKGLAAEGILIKDFGSVPGLKDHVRITIGGKRHTDIFLKKIRKVI